MLDFSIRIFGSDDCDRCRSIKNAFEFYGVPYEYVDANDPKNDALCDAHEVDELPQVEAFFPKNNFTFYKFVGYINPSVFIERAVVTNSNIEKFYDTTIADVKKNIDLDKLHKEIEENRKSTGCTACGRKKNAE